jgi:hypothetical protein
VVLDTHSSDCSVLAPLVPNQKNVPFIPIEAGKCIFLRANDIIRIRELETILVVTASIENIQVDSSAPGLDPANNSSCIHRYVESSLQISEVADTDVDLVDIRQSFPVGTTPIPSADKTEVVTETPATDRYFDNSQSYALKLAVQTGEASAVEEDHVFEFQDCNAVPSTTEAEHSQMDNGSVRKPSVSSITKQLNSAGTAQEQVDQYDALPSTSYILSDSAGTFARKRDFDLTVIANKQLASTSDLSCLQSKRKRNAKGDEEDVASKKIKSENNTVERMAEVKTPRQRRGRPRKDDGSLVSEIAESSQNCDIHFNSPQQLELRTSSRSASSPRLYSADKSLKRVIFSNSAIPKRKYLISFLRSKGVTFVDDPHKQDFDLLIIGLGELKRTGKLLLAVALGKEIVTDEWVNKSVKKKALQPTSAYVPSDVSRETQWEFHLRDAIENPRTNLFKGHTIYITAAQKKKYGKLQWEIEDLLQKCAAKGVKMLTSKIAKTLTKSEQIIIIAADQDDPDVPKLFHKGIPCFNQDFVSISILRGRLELGSNEFKIQSNQYQT